jgi:hypothetical protein
MSYQLTTKSNNIVVNVNKSAFNLSIVKKPEYSVSLSRTGGQGAKGTSVTNARVDENGFLIITLSNGTEINAGYVGSTSLLTNLAFTGSLSDITGGELSTGVIQGGIY